LLLAPRPAPASQGTPGGVTVLPTREYPTNLTPASHHSEKHAPPRWTAANALTPERYGQPSINLRKMESILDDIGLIILFLLDDNNILRGENIYYESKNF
jgi:hypothetical protein